MKPVDIDAIARQADPGYAGNQQSPFDSSCLAEFAARVFEKAAQGAFSSVEGFGLNSVWAEGYVEGVNDCAQGLRAMAAALQSGDRVRP